MVDFQPYHIQKKEHNFHATTTMQTKIKNEESFLLYLKE